MTSISDSVPRIPKGRLFAASATVIVVGLVVYGYNGSSDVTLKNDHPTSINLTHGDTTQAIKPSKESSIEARISAQNVARMESEVVKEDVVSIAPNSDHLSGRSVNESQYQASVGSSLLAESMLSAQARVRKMSGSQHTGLGLAQRNAQLQYRISATRQQLASVHRQLQQLEWAANPGRVASRSVSGKKAPDQKTMELARLQSRVGYLQYQLAMQTQSLKQFQRRFPPPSQHARGLNPAMQQQIQHRFN